MRLTDLEPKYFSDQTKRRLGISFLCPHCKQVRLGVAFANPEDGGSPIDIVTNEGMPKIIKDLIHEKREFDVPPGFCWLRSGTDFDIMSLSPSVDASKSGHWHGFIINGEVS